MRIFAGILLFVCISFSQGINPPTGFQDIPFGITKDTFKMKWDKKFPHDTIGQEYDSARVHSENYNKYDLKDIGNFYYVNDFKLGEGTYTLFIFFNKNNKFYKYSFDCPKYSANYLQTTVMEDVEYLSKVFQKKFGNPMLKHSPKFFDIKDGYVSYYWKWRFKKQTVYTGLSVYESEYYASATVYDDDLEKEHEIIIKKEESKSIDRAANQS